MIQIKRVYEPDSHSDGKRYLVERLWPRGIRKDELKMEGWLKDVAPSPELRKWYQHDVEKWPEFEKRYRAELKSNSDAVEPLREAAKHGNVTLLYAARDTEHNSAKVLKDYLERKS